MQRRVGLVALSRLIEVSRERMPLSWSPASEQLPQVTQIMRRVAVLQVAMVENRRPWEASTIIRIRRRVVKLIIRPSMQVVSRPIEWLRKSKPLN